jgi:hypothetical protein
MSQSSPTTKHILSTHTQDPVRFSQRAGGQIGHRRQVRRRAAGTYRAAELHVPADDGYLIACDHPYVLTWIDPDRRGKFFPPGLGLRGTEVLFPVSSELALSGTFELQPPDRRLHPIEVPMFNGVMIAAAERQVYARDDQFQYHVRRLRSPRRDQNCCQALRSLTQGANHCYWVRLGAVFRAPRRDGSAGA